MEKQNETGRMKELNRSELAAEASKVLGFYVSNANIKGVVELYDWETKPYPSADKSRAARDVLWGAPDELKKLREDVELVLKTFEGVEEQVRQAGALGEKFTTLERHLAAVEKQAADATKLLARLTDLETKLKSAEDRQKVMMMALRLLPTILGKLDLVAKRLNIVGPFVAVPPEVEKLLSEKAG
jgi:predicted  nucleic acid-binding Zn-ribbon protein